VSDVDPVQRFGYIRGPESEMNKRLDDAIAKVQALPDDKQSEAAALLFEFLDQEQAGFSLTPEQVAEIERRLSDDEPFATDDEVRAVFRRLTT
jgi:hypothetical protein